MTRRRSVRLVRESFVVHVYRRGDEPGHEVTGFVESVQRGTACAFRGRDDLWTILVGEDTANAVPGTGEALASPRRPE